MRGIRPYARLAEKQWQPRRRRRYEVHQDGRTFCLPSYLPFLFPFIFVFFVVAVVVALAMHYVYGAAPRFGKDE
jgi:hypothetical protein